MTIEETGQLIGEVGAKKPTPYADLYDKAVLRQIHKAEVTTMADRIAAGKAQYEGVAADLANGIPWWFIGITHFMEAGLKWPHQFNFHLHCGDPLTGRTFHVPKGRPLFNPWHGDKPASETNPYSWHESAIDALQLSGFHKIKDWSIENCLIQFEKFNGLGYKERGVPSPYLWSFTSIYVKGKYVLDGKYDPEAVSKQPGCAAIMKAIGI